MNGDTVGSMWRFENGVTLIVDISNASKIGFLLSDGNFEILHKDGFKHYIKLNKAKLIRDAEYILTECIKNMKKIGCYWNTEGCVNW